MQVTKIQSTEGKRAALWDITGSCNLRCKHCYQFDLYNYEKRGPYQHDLSTAEAKEVLARLIEAKFTHIHFLGGEPLLRPDLLELAKEAKAYGMYISINTNGLLLTPKKVEQLRSVGVDQIMVSLDGATAATNDAIRGQATFDISTRNLKAALALTDQSSMTIGITFTATSFNSQEIPQLLKLVLDYGIEHIHIVPVQEAGNFVRNREHLGNEELFLISCIEEGLRTYGAQLVGRTRIRIDLRLWSTEVLNKKYGNILEPDPIGIKCQGGKKFVVIQANGRLGSCSAALDPNFSKPVVQRRHLSAQPEYVHLMAPGTLDHSETLKAFYRFQHDPDTFANLRPCDHCRFFEQCQPCPIEYANERLVHQCIWAEQEEQRQREKLLASALAPVGSFDLQGTSLVNDSNDISIKLGPMLSAVITETGSRSRSINDVLNSCFDPPLTEEQSHEIIEALEKLVAFSALRTEPLGG
jgi:MoaA/NifB/PqqE/SkfB family radical SAM enzyme